MTGELPAGWVEANIPDVLAELKSGKIIDQGWSPRCEKHPSADETTWGALKTTAIQDGWFEPQHTKQLPRHLDPKPELEVGSDDILLTCAGPRNRCGVVCKVPSVRRKLFISGKMYRFRADSRVIETDYLEAVLRSPKLKRDIDKIKTGGSESGLNLTQSRFKGLSIPLPPLAEQRRIVRKLDRLTAHSTTARTHLTALKTLVERYKLAILSEIYFGSALEKAPRGSFLDIVEKSQNGLSKRRGEEGKATKVLRLADLVGNAFSGEQPRSIKLTEQEREKFALNAGDIVIVRVNGSEKIVGRFLVWGDDKNWAFCDHFIRAKLNERALPDFVRWYFETDEVRRKIEATFVSSAGQKTVSKKTLGQINIPLPPLEEQREIVRRIDAAFARIDLLAGEAERALKLLGHLDQRILERAFCGGLVSQNPEDEPAAALLARIKTTRAATPAKKRRGRTKA